MTPNEFTKAMTFLGLNYNKGFTTEHIQMLYPRFASYSYEQIKEAIRKCIDNEKYINNIAYDLGQYLPSVERKTEKALEYANDFKTCPRTKKMCPLDVVWVWAVIKFD